MADSSPTRPTPEDKARIEAVVAECIQALEHGEPDPATRLCGADSELLNRVQRRLAQLAARGLIPDSEMLPAAIGPYRVLKELGSGGMGHVYLADQTSPVRRKVALKVIKLGMDTREVVARFQAERQALALMSHPHIAQMFDAGITREGRPYFVMEYVPGQMLTVFCDQRAMNTEARVRLMVTICRAVQHAHDRGFIHRDLKPSNILVAEHEGAFVPKIIDFGVAKATAAIGADDATRVASLQTRADQVLGTPEYMSPEQMGSGGLDVDTRTDVWSLGVTLYELLCGELPFDSRSLRRGGWHEMERILRDELPTQPSKRLQTAAGEIVAARGGERGTVHRVVAGELDWITLKALAKQREQRYPSAVALAEDLQRWLDHEPVVAAPPGRSYRLRKFVRRHSVWVGAGALVLLVLVVGLVVSLRATWIAVAARANESAALADVRKFFALTRDAIGNLVDVAGEQLAEVPQAEGARRQVLEKALQFYGKLRELQPLDVELRIDRVVAVGRIGRLQNQLGKPTDALATFDECIAVTRELAADVPHDARVDALMADVLNQRAMTATSLGRRDDARNDHLAALAALERGGQKPGAWIDPLLEARVVGNLAIDHDDDTPRALELFARAFAAFGRAGDAPQRERARARLAVEHAKALTRANRIADAAAALGDAVGSVRSLPDPTTARAREDEAHLQDERAGVLRRLDRRSEARTAQQRAIELYAGLAAEHPQIPMHADNAAAGWHALAQLEEGEAKHGDALAAARKAVAIREELVARFPQLHRVAMRCARSLLLQADLQIQAWQHHGGDREAAMPTMRRCLELADSLQHAHANDLDVLITFCAAHGAMGSLRTTYGDHEEALEQHLEVRDVLLQKLQTFETDADLHYHLASNGNHLVQAHYLLRQPADAVAAGEVGLRHLERGLALDAKHVALRQLIPTLVGRLASARFAMQDPAGAVATLRTMCERPDWDADTREQGCILLAQCVQKLDGHAQRHEWLELAIDHLQKAVAARGSPQEALARPAQREGVSLHRSRLRDFDLLQSLADACGDLGIVDEQEAALAQAFAIYRSHPDISGDRVRNLFTQRIEALLAKGDAAGATAAADELLAAVGEHGGANYLLAVLLTKTAELDGTDAAREALRTKAVACLRRALDDREVRAGAAQHPNFGSLRGRADYEALLAR